MVRKKDEEAKNAGNRKNLAQGAGGGATEPGSPAHTVISPLRFMSNFKFNLFSKVCDPPFF